MSSAPDSAEPAPRPYRTPHELTTGGVLKSTPEDFVVEEVPLYPASGAGDFFFVEVEKRDVSAEELVRRLSRALGIPRLDIGVAGLKDRRAVTRQRISVPAKCEAALQSWNDPDIALRGWERHNHKLRTGHLAGNRFTIRLRGVRPDALAAARQIAAAIGPSGYPNDFGDQRFGRDQETLVLGRELLRGTKTPRDIAPSRRKFLLRLALSAVQSDLFNAVLAERLAGGTFETVLPGDVLQVRASGGLFVTDDPPREQERLQTGEVALTGPMFGPKMKAPTAAAAALEERVLAATGIPPAAFARFSKLTSGTRRALGVLPGEFSVEQESADSLLFRFTLPPGAYATTVLREFIKEGGTAAPESDTTDEMSDESDEQ